MYLHYKIIHSKRFFNSVKKSTAEQERALKVGRLMEILEEQVKPTLSVFIAQGIDAVFNVFALIIIVVVTQLGSAPPIQGHILLAVQLYQYCSHAVVYGMLANTFTKKLWASMRRSEVQRKAK